MEMQSFFYLFTRYLSEKASSQELFVSVTQLDGSSYLLALATGIASSRLLLIRLSRTTNCLK
jgi:hypothetical protein